MSLDCDRDLRQMKLFRTYCELKTRRSEWNASFFVPVYQFFLFNLHHETRKE